MGGDGRAQSPSLSAGGNVAVRRQSAGCGRRLFARGVLGSAEIFDPVTLGWTPTGSLVNQSFYSTSSATLLMDGRVLAVTGNDAELYDPATGSWTPTGSLSYSAYANTATRLGDGTVLVTGGWRTRPDNASVNNVELYDPTVAAWSLVGNLHTGRAWHTATSLPNGHVLVVGGLHFEAGVWSPLKSTELYNPATRTWSLADELGTGRFYHAETLLRVRRPERGEFTVLVAGGDDRPDLSSASNWHTLSSVELYSGVPPPIRG